MVCTMWLGGWQGLCGWCCVSLMVLTLCMVGSLAVLNCFRVWFCRVWWRLFHFLFRVLLFIFGCWGVASGL